MLAGPVIEHTGGGCTLSTTSSDLMHPVTCTTVSRNVAVAEETRAVVMSEAGSSIVAEPLTTLQAFDAMGCTPLDAAPFRVKTVSSPSEQRVWSGPALAAGPMFSVYS